MVISDAILLTLTRQSGLPYEYIESIARGGYFDGIEESDLPRHLALMELSYEGQKLKLWE